MDKLERAERDYTIAVLRLAGQSFPSISARCGVSRQNATNIARANEWLVVARKGRVVPKGLSTRAAVAIEKALGIWPTNADKAAVEAGAIKIMKAESGRRTILEDIGRWLEL